MAQEEGVGRMTDPNNNTKGKLRPTLISAGSVVIGEEVGSGMTDDSSPLATFFHVVLDELRKRLTPTEFSELLKEVEDS
jgi:hypothetical protein